MDSNLEVLIFGFFYGIAFSVFLIGAFFYWVNRDKTNLLLSIYTISTIFYFLSTDNIGVRHLWKDAHVNSFINDLTALITVLSLIFYSIYFLHLQVRFSKVIRMTNWFVGVRVFIFMLEFFGILPNTIVSLCIDTIALIGMLLLGFHSIRSGYQPAKLYVVGFIFLILGFISHESSSLLFANGNGCINQVDQFLHVGFIVQLLLQTLALTERYRDIDQKIEIQEKDMERSKSRNMLMDILDYIPHQVFLKDHNHQLVLFNKRVADLHHMRREDLVGKTDYELFDKEIAKGYIEMEKKVLVDGESIINPNFQHVGKDGEVKVFESMKVPFYMSDTETYGLLGVEFEITELKRQEKMLVDQNHEIEAQKEQISELLLNVTDSIKTAKMIQEAIMPPEQALAEYFHDYFVLYLPKDIVSGDFYWFKYPSNRDKIMFATVDCTGHGVAGAFISLIANNLLNKIVDSNIFNNPADILNKLNDEVMLALNQGSKGSGSHDGMDITLCELDLQTMELQFAGACSQLCLVRGGQLLVYKTDHFSIGYLNNKRRLFSNFSIKLQSEDMLYIYSDGFAGQFGGEDGNEKFKYNRLRDMLAQIAPLKMEDQKFKLKDALESWRGTQEQTDDVMVLGFKF